MNPLSALTYCRRHKGATASILALISLVTAGLYLMAALSWGIFIEPLRLNRLFVSRISVVLPLGSEPGVATQLRANPDVERVAPAIISLGISLPTMLGDDSSWFSLLALYEDDAPRVVERCGATLVQGRLPRPRAREIVFSQDVAAALDLRVGDVIQNTLDPDLYSNIVDPLQVVGILQSDVRLGIISYEYVSSHEIYAAFPTRFLVIPRQGRAAAVEAWLENEIRSPRTNVWTLATLDSEMADEYRTSLSVLIPIVAVVSIAISLAIVAFNQITFGKRLAEFGLLHAAGHSLGKLTLRLTKETALWAGVGWMSGVGLSWLALHLLNLTIFGPRGHALTVISAGPAILVLLIPLSVIGVAWLDFRRMLGRLDAVAVVERGKMSVEVRRRRGVERSSRRPLAFSTFFFRHRCRSILLVSSMTLLIVAVALVVFILSATHDAQRASLGSLKHIRVVSARLGAHLDPAIATQLRSHADVERVIPAFQHTMLDIFVPPFGGATINPYAVYAADLPYLIDLYDLELKEGHLPRPRTNELVIPESVAQNRLLHVGDVIGNRDQPAYPGAMVLPAPFDKILLAKSVGGLPPVCASSKLGRFDV